MPNLSFMLSHPVHLLSLGFGTGLAKKAPGTVGTLVGFPLFYALSLLPELWHLPIVFMLFALGVHCCELTGRALGVADHGSIVWDEVVAMMLVLEFTPAHPLAWALAFALFRVFDIWKPFPIRQLDQRTRGGVGVMLDDILAAIYAIIYLKGFEWVWMHYAP